MKKCITIKEKKKRKSAKLIYEKGKGAVCDKRRLQICRLAGKRGKPCLEML